jgi:hypothetical protein
MESRDADVPARPWDRCSTSMATETSYWEYTGCPQALKLGLIDQVVLNVVPVVFGSGRPFFATGTHCQSRSSWRTRPRSCRATESPPGLRRQALTPRATRRV